MRSSDIGVQPGGKIEGRKLPGGKIVLAAARPKGSIDKFIGLLADRTSKVAALEDVAEPRRPDGPVDRGTAPRGRRLCVN